VSVERLQTKDGEEAKIGHRAYDKHNGRLAQVGLTQQIAMLPTPQSRDYKNSNTDPEKKDRLNRKLEQGWTIDLNDRIAMLPTPASRDYKGASHQMGRDCLDSVVEMGATKGQIGQNTGLRLHPAFALWMLGYPETWCDLEDGE
jgi:hypothetical protein